MSNVFLSQNLQSVRCDFWSQHTWKYIAHQHSSSLSHQFQTACITDTYDIKLLNVKKNDARSHSSWQPCHRKQQYKCHSDHSLYKNIHTSVHCSDKNATQQLTTIRAYRMKLIMKYRKNLTISTLPQCNVRITFCVSWIVQGLQMQTRKGIKPTTESAGSVQFGQSYSSSMDWFQSDLTFRLVQFSSLYPKS